MSSQIIHNGKVAYENPPEIYIYRWVEIGLIAWRETIREGGTLSTSYSWQIMSRFVRHNEIMGKRSK